VCGGQAPSAVMKKNADPGQDTSNLQLAWGGKMCTHVSVCVYLCTCPSLVFMREAQGMGSFSFLSSGLCIQLSAGHPLLAASYRHVCLLWSSGPPG
jgi:hypothetical protein